MKKLTILALFALALTLTGVTAAFAADEPVAPTAEELSLPCEAPAMSVEPQEKPQGDPLLSIIPDALPMDGTCGPVQSECRSCPQGVKACDYHICYTSSKGFHKDTIFCTPCGSFC